MIMNQIRNVLAVFVLFWSAYGSAAVESTESKIGKLLNDVNNYGQCMMKITYESNISCANHWVSLDCKGDFIDRAVSRRMWDSAQLAFATNSTVFVVVSDAIKHNGHCVVVRLDISK